MVVVVVVIHTVVICKLRQYIPKRHTVGSRLQAHRVGLTRLRQCLVQRQQCLHYDLVGLQNISSFHLDNILYQCPQMLCRDSSNHGCIVGTELRKELHVLVSLFGLSDACVSVRQQRRSGNARREPFRGGESLEKRRVMVLKGVLVERGRNGLAGSGGGFADQGFFDREEEFEGSKERVGVQRSAHVLHHGAETGGQSEQDFVLVINAVGNVR